MNTLTQCHEASVPPPVPAMPAAPPLPYHRLNRMQPRSSRWWRPVAAILVSVGLYGVLAVAFAMSLAISREVGGATLASPNADDPTNPFDWLVGLGMIALMIPAVILGMRWGGGARGTIHSVRGRIRWGLLLRGAVIALPLYALILGGAWLIGPPEDVTWPTPGWSLVAVFVLIVVLAPLQSAGEEYLFRGLPMQALGTWLRSPLWGILLPVPLFVLGHGYNWVGSIAVAVGAICCGALTWKSGGLELAIVLHVANNLVLMLLAPFSPSSLQQGEVPVEVLPFDVILTVGTTALLWWWASRRHGVAAWEAVTTASRVRGGAVRSAATSG
ncbi:MAG: CPBP family intramembrane metalloprotease [Microbacterium sp.]